MTDELQDALTSATSDPIEELKQEIGQIDEAKSQKPAPEPKKDSPEEGQGEEQEEDSKAESDKNADVDKDAQEEKPKRTPQQLKIERQAAANRRQLQLINDLKAENEKLKASKPANDSQVDDGAPKKPSMDDFDSYEDYERANIKYQDELVEYKAERKVQEREAQLRQEYEQRQEQERNQKILEEFNARAEKFKARHKNYERNEEAVNDALTLLKNEGVQGVETMARYALESELSPNLIHHLGENLHLVDDIAKMSDIGIVKELYKLEMSLGNQSTGERKLPKPVDKLRSSNDGDKSMVDMSWEELQKKMNL